MRSAQVFDFGDQMLALIGRIPEVREAGAAAPRMPLLHRHRIPAAFSPGVPTHPEEMQARP
jgi:hypothetical protein